MAEAEGDPSRIADDSDDRSAGERAKALTSRVETSEPWTAHEIRASVAPASRLRDHLLEKRPQFDVVLLFHAWMGKLASSAATALAEGITPLERMNAILAKGDLSEEDLAQLQVESARLDSAGDLPTKEIQDLRTSAIALLVAGTNISYYDDPAARTRAWEALRAQKQAGLDLTITVDTLSKHLEVEEDPAVSELGTAVLAEIKQ